MQLFNLKKKVLFNQILFLQLTLLNLIIFIIKIIK